MSNNLTRVHLKLSDDVDQLLVQQVVKQGGTKSRLLRQWLNNISWNRLIPYSISTSGYRAASSFNLRLASSNVQKLDAGCKELEVSRNQLVHLVILNAIFNPYCLSGQQTRTSELETNTDQLSLIKQSIREGKYKKALSQMDILESTLITKPQQNLGLIELNILRARLFRHHRRLDIARRNLDRCLQLANQVNSIGQIRECLSQLAVLDEIQDNLESAIKLAVKAVALESERYSQTRLVNLYALQADIDQVDEISGEALDFTFSTCQKKIICQQRIAMAELRIGRLQSAKERLLETDAHLDADMQTERRYNLENMGVILLIQGDERTAYQKLIEAEEIEMQTKSDHHFSKAKLFRLFIEAKYDFLPAFKQMRSMVELQLQPVYVGLGKYIIYSAALINNQDNMYSRLGYNRLHELSKSAPNQMLKNASQQTLATGRLQAVI